ncbi:MAG: hypothetical protein Kow0025_12930 [Thermodesulfovibrionales bacterium]
MKKKSEERAPAKEQPAAREKAPAREPAKGQAAAPAAKSASKAPARPARKAPARPAASAAGVSARGEIGIKKQCPKGRATCKVTFVLPKEAASGASRVTIVGDFNGWDEEANPLKRLANGNFTVTLELDKGREYRFRYLIDGERWENDWCADRYEPNPHGTEDSVVVVG